MIYLAAPFFNDAQLNLCKNMEERFKALDIACHSPRLCMVVSHKSDADERSTAFWQNIAAIKKASLMLATLDFLLPMKHQLRVVQIDAWNSNAVHGAVIPVWLRSPSLFLPDTGTVFEMGIAHAAQIPIVGFTIQEPKKLNLMLAESCFGIIQGLDGFDKFFANGITNLDWKGAQKWNQAIF